MNNPAPHRLEERVIDSVTIARWKTQHQHPETWRELRDFFLEHSAQLLQNMCLACTLNDRVELEKLAHQLQGIATSFGAAQLARLSALIQEQCACQPHHKMLRLLQALTVCYTHTRVEIMGY